jgi:hypothetical protein
MHSVGGGDPAVNAGELEALQRAWVTFLRQWAWQWFCTFTFREIVHPEAADNAKRLTQPALVTTSYTLVRSQLDLVYQTPA